MKYGYVPGIEKPISRLVQGTVWMNSQNVDESFALLDAVYEMGCRTFDTAHNYGHGECERTVGQWIRERGVREEIVILGKGGHHNADRKRVTPFDITSDLYDSLARLKTDYIDLYVLHRDDPSQPIGPLVEILNEHYEAGLIRAFGGSNWSHHRIREANEYAEAHGLQPFVVSSPQFSLAVQIETPWPGCLSVSGPEGEEARAWYAAQGIPLFTWSSLAGGFFSGRFMRNNLDTFTEYYDVLCVKSYCSEENFQRLDRARMLAEQKGATLPQIALAYVLNQPVEVFALVGCRTPEEFRINTEALGIELTPQEIAWLELKTDSPA